MPASTLPPLQRIEEEEAETEEELSRKCQKSKEEAKIVVAQVDSETAIERRQDTGIAKVSTLAVLVTGTSLFEESSSLTSLST